MKVTQTLSKKFSDQAKEDVVGPDGAPQRPWRILKKETGLTTVLAFKKIFEKFLILDENSAKILKLTHFIVL